MEIGGVNIKLPFVVIACGPEREHEAIDTIFKNNAYPQGPSTKTPGLLYQTLTLPNPDPLMDLYEPSNAHPKTVLYVAEPPEFAKLAKIPEFAEHDPIAKLTKLFSRLARLDGKPDPRDFGAIIFGRTILPDSPISLKSFCRTRDLLEVLKRKWPVI